MTISSAALWGSAYPVIQLSLKYYDSFTITVYRALFGAAVLSLYVIFTKKPSRLLREDVKYLVVASVIGASGFWTLLSLSVQFLQSDVSSFLAALYPLIAVVFASLVFHEKMKPSSIIGVLLGIFGTFIIVVFGENASFTGSSPIIGTLISLGASFVWAGYLIMSRFLISRKSASGAQKSPEYITLYTFLFAIPLTLLLMLATSSGKYFLQPSPNGIFYVGYLGIAASGLAFLLFNKGMKLIGITRAAINQLLFPAVTVIVTFFIFGATVNLFEIVGMFFIIGGILIAQLIH